MISHVLDDTTYPIALSTFRNPHPQSHLRSNTKCTKQGAVDPRTFSQRNMPFVYQQKISTKALVASLPPLVWLLPFLLFVFTFEHMVTCPVGRISHHGVNE